MMCKFANLQMRLLLIFLFALFFNSCNTNKYFIKKKINSFTTVYYLRKQLKDSCNMLVCVDGIPHYSFYKIYQNKKNTTSIEWYYEDEIKYILSNDTTSNIEHKHFYQLSLFNEILKEKIIDNKYWVKTADTVSPIFNTNIKKYIIRNISE